MGTLRAMATRSKCLLSLLSFTLLALPSEALAYRDLCTSSPSSCEYAPPTAPYLNSDVCLDSTGFVSLKGAGSCPSGSWPYYLGYGEVIDLQTNEVQGYIPVDDACGATGLCVEYEPHTGGQSDEMCCISTTCYPNVTCGGTIWWCYDGVSEEDGTITCFAAEQVG